MRAAPSFKGFLCRALLLAATAALLAAPVADRIVAVVGDEIITERELEKAYNRDSLHLMKGDTTDGSSEKLTKAEYLARMIEQKLIEQEVKRQGIEIEDMDVDRTIERRRKELGFTEEEFRRALSMQGIEMEHYREAIRKQLTTNRLIRKEVKGEIEISDREIEAYYNQHPERFMGEDSYHIYLIFLRFGSSGDKLSRQEKIEEMKRIRSEIDSLSSFQDMARKHSDAPNASNGGDIGYMLLEEMAKVIRKHVKGLSPREMSPVFYDDSAVYLVYLADVKKGKRKPLSEVSDRIRRTLYHRQSMERYQIWFERLKARTYTENRLKKENPSP